MLLKGKLAEIHGPVTEQRASHSLLYTGGYSYEPHTVGWITVHSSLQDLVLFASDTCTVQPLTHTHTHTHTQTD